MKIVVKSLDRETLNFYGDNEIVHIGTTNNYNVCFLLIVNGNVIESNLTTEYGGELSFDEAERVVKELIINKGGRIVKKDKRTLERVKAILSETEQKREQLLVIQFEDENSAPVIYHKGKRLKYLDNVTLEWGTARVDGVSNLDYEITRHTKGFKKEIIKMRTCHDE